MRGLTKVSASIGSVQRAREFPSPASIVHTITTRTYASTHVRAHARTCFPIGSTRSRELLTHCCAHIGYRGNMISGLLLWLLLYSFLDRGRSLTVVQLCTERINNEYSREALRAQAANMKEWFKSASSNTIVIENRINTIIMCIVCSVFILI